MQVKRIGFILTSHSIDQNNSYEIHLYGKSTSAPFLIKITNQHPLFFVENDKEIPKGQYDRKSLSLKNFNNKGVDGLYFKTQKESYDFNEKLKEKGIRSFESDVRGHERFLMERFLRGSLEIIGEVKLEGELEVFVNPILKPSDSKVSLSILSFDIETSRKNDLLSIGLHFFDGKNDVRKVFMVGDNQGPLEEGELVYYKTQKDCYCAFEKSLIELDPDLITGWHVVGFDLAFLERKCTKWGILMSLGRQRSRVQISEKTAAGQFARIKGRVVIDGPVVMRSNFFKFENYKLDTVASELLGEGKDIKQTSLEKVQEIERRFKEDKVSLAKYNLQDCLLVSKILEKTKVIDLLMTRSQISGLQLDRLGVSTSAFDFHLLPKVHRKGYVAPNIIDIVRESQSSGGLVLEPVSGIHDHVIVLDFKSLYPSIIRTFKIDPFSRMKGDIQPLRNPSGVNFSKTEHVLPILIERLMEQREEAKRENNQPLSQAIKILMNSFYGVMGSGGSRFYHADLPTAITSSGQWILRETIDFFKDLGFEVLYGDTDSIFLKLKGLEFKGPYERGMELSKKATEHLNKVISRNFDTESFLEMEFEKYYRKFFLPELRIGQGGAKKKYAGLLSEKNRPESLQFSGMEFVRSDWTKLAKAFQFSLFENFFRDENLEDIIRETVKNLKEGVHDDLLVYKKRLTKDLAEYTKSIPPHVKAARLLKEAGLQVDRDIYYIMTRRGPIPIELDTSDTDYEHYIDKQLRPIADTILQTMGKSFDSILTGDQLNLF